MGDYSCTFRIHNLTGSTLEFNGTTQAHGYWIEGSRTPHDNIKPHSVSEQYQLKDSFGIYGTDGTLTYVFYIDGVKFHLYMYFACPGGSPMNRATIKVEPETDVVFGSVMGLKPEGFPSGFEYFLGPGK